jgi:hypothetical protein
MEKKMKKLITETLSKIGIYRKSLKKAAMNWLALLVPIVTFISAFITYALSKQYSRKTRAILIILAFIISYCGAIYILQDQTNKLAHSTSGTISSDVRYPCVIAGTNHFNVGPNGEVNPLSLFYLGTIFDPMLRLKLEKGYLKVSTIIRDEDGKYLAGIVDNNWDTAAQPLILDKNFDKNAFEVIDSYKKVMLQVSLAGDCANVSGIFYGPGGEATVIAGDRITRLVPDKTHNIIEPIFVYPSTEHLGERVKK